MGVASCSWLGRLEMQRPGQSEVFPPLLEVATCIKSGKPFPTRPERRMQGAVLCRKDLA